MLQHMKHTITVVLLSVQIFHTKYSLSRASYAELVFSYVGKNGKSLIASTLKSHFPCNQTQVYGKLFTGCSVRMVSV